MLRIAFVLLTLLATARAQSLPTVQKQLTRCRKSWEDMDLGDTRQLGRTVRPGDVLKLTLHYGCDGFEQVQLCAHDPVACRTLSDRSRKCTPPPAMDGSKINPPPNRQR